MILGKLVLGGDVSQIRFTVATAAGLVLGIAGTALRVACYNKLGKEFTYELTVKEDHRLVTTGPYSIVRHPSYAGALMAVTSIALLHQTRGSWLRESGVLSYLPAQIGFGVFTLLQISAHCFMLARMKDEDEALRRRFRDEWDAWAARVRYMIIPGLF